MFRLIYIIVLIIATTVFAPYFIGKQGVVIVEVAGYSYTTSFIIFLLILVLVLAVIYLIELFLRTLSSSIFGYSNWILKSRDNKSVKLTQEALVYKGAGNYTKARKLLAKGFKNSRFPLVNLSESFEIALLEGDYKSAENYLNHAVELTDGEYVLLVEIMRIKLYSLVGKYQEAKDHLIKLSPSDFNHEVIKLAIDIYLSTKDYDKLSDLLLIAKERKVIDQEQYVDYKRICESGMIEQYSDDKTLLLWFNGQNKERRNSIISRNQILNKLISFNSDKVDEFAKAIYKDFSLEQIESSLFFSLLLQSKLTIDSGVNKLIDSDYLKKQSILLAGYLAKLNFKYPNKDIKTYIDYLIEQHEAEFYPMALVVYHDLGFRKELLHTQDLIAQSLKDQFNINESIPNIIND